MHSLRQQFSIVVPRNHFLAASESLLALDSRTPSSRDPAILSSSSMQDSKDYSLLDSFRQS